MKVIAMLALAITVAATEAGAVEQAVYTVLEQDGRCELREYEGQVVAETVVSGTMEQAGNAAFRPLFRYISGANADESKIAMTAPVSMQSTGDAWSVSFMMPDGMVLDRLPTPSDAKVQLREVPANKVAAIRYSGRWTEEGYRSHLEKLRAWMESKGIVATGEPTWARYNPPFTPWFLRRNEILIPIEAMKTAPQVAE